jgi:Fur family ferric uptake transcriptional regulator
MKSESYPTSMKMRERLHRQGLKATSQRLLILKILFDSEIHLDAETIWKLGQNYDQKLSLATIYRTLKTFEETGLVEQRYFARDHKREYYEPGHKEEHFHFTCILCKKVIEVNTLYIAKAMKELSRRLAIEITHSCVCFEGYCQPCLSSNETK